MDLIEDGSNGKRLISFLSSTTADYGKYPADKVHHLVNKSQRGKQDVQKPPLEEASLLEEHDSNSRMHFRRCR